MQCEKIHRRPRICAAHHPRPGSAGLKPLVPHILLFLGAMLCAGPACAAAPLRTDDANPTDAQKWEVDLFSSGTIVQGGGSGVLPGLEVDYGVIDGVQLHLSQPLGYARSSGKRLGFGSGDTELGLKIRLLKAEESAWWPSLAFAPLIEVPTGNRSLGLSSGHAQVFLPLWLSKEFGDLTLAAGGGRWTNPGIGNKDWWYAGVAALYRLTPDLALGGEMFHQTAPVVGGKDAPGFNLGAVLKLTETMNLTASAGRGLQNASRTNALSYYTGLQFNF